MTGSELTIGARPRADRFYAGGDDVKLGSFPLPLPRGVLPPRRLMRGCAAKSDEAGNPAASETRAGETQLVQGSTAPRAGLHSYRTSWYGCRGRVRPVGGGGPGGSQALPVLRTVHGLRNVLDVLHPSAFVKLPKGQHYKVKLELWQRLPEMRGRVSFRIHRDDLASSGPCAGLGFLLMRRNVALE